MDLKNDIARDKFNLLIEQTLFGLRRYVLFLPNVHSPIPALWATGMERSHHCRKSWNSRYSSHKQCMITYSVPHSTLSAGRLKY